MTGSNMTHFILLLLLLTCTVSSRDLSFSSYGEKKHVVNAMDQTRPQATLHSEPDQIIEYMEQSTIDRNYPVDQVETTDRDFISFIEFPSRHKRSPNVPCEQNESCDLVSQIIPRQRYCHCDDDCGIYNDCCPEKRNHLNSSVGQQLNENSFACLTNGVSILYGVVVITNCSTNNNDNDLSSKCQNKNVSTTGPWVIDDFGRTYRNMYCALCNHVTTYKYYSMAAILDTVDQHNRTQIGMAITDDDALGNIEYIPPQDYNVRSCFLQGSVTPNSSDACQSYGTNPVLQLDVYFKNAFCTKDLEEKILCVNDFRDTRVSNAMFPLTVIFPFTPNNANTPECLEMGDGLCLGEETYMNFKIEVSFMALVNKTYDQTFFKKVITILIWSIRVPNVTNVRSYKYYYMSENNQTLSIAEITIVLTEHLSWRGVLKYKKLVQNLNRTVVIDHGYDKSTIYFTKPLVEHYNAFPDDYTPMPYGFGIFRTVEDRFTRDISWRGNYVNSLCPSLVVYITTGTNGIEIVDDVCHSLSKVAATSHIYNAKVVITYLGFSLSIVSLVCLIVLTRKAGQHNTTAGAHSQNIYFSLLVALCLFTVGIGLSFNAVVCKVMASTLHYSWLAVFSFKSIAVLSFVRILWNDKGNRSQSRDETSKAKICYRVLGLFLPMPVVLTLALLDHFNVLRASNRELQNVCFPTAFPANLIFVTAPIVLCLVVNIICLLLVIVYIRKTKSASMPLSKTNTYSEAVVYLRLSIVSGLPWVLGIVATFVQTDTIDFVFILLCSFQGVFIVISNITTQSFRQKLNLRFRKAETSQLYSGREIN